MKTREQIQLEAFQALKRNNYTGTICLSTGSGKSKVAIDCIKEGRFKNILITSPRTNLKENWNKELHKWDIKRLESPLNGVKVINSYFYLDTPLRITLENIQTCYKWSLEEINEFDLIIADEIHTIVTPEYGNLLINAAELDIRVIGLTATPDKDKVEKQIFYNDYCPIVYEYYDSAEDGIINKRQYITIKYPLTDNYKVLAGTTKKPFITGELTQYKYLTDNLRKGQQLMASTGSSDWFTDAADWFWNGNGNLEQKTAARIYLQAIKFRKEFLWNLSSSADITLKLKEKIFATQSNNKILFFSELTKQADKLTPYTVHSKKDAETNSRLIGMFNKGEIKELGSCNSLTLGLNLVGATHAIIESFNSSDVVFQQKAGRTDRLSVDDVATILFVVPEGTQAEEWYKKITKKLEIEDKITEYNDLNFDL